MSASSVAMGSPTRSEASSPGTPSAEGPLKTKSAQSWSFRTYGPLRVEEARYIASVRGQRGSGHRR